MRYMSAWLQWSLSRPNSGFRDEVVELPFVVGKDEDGEEITQKRPFLELPAVTAADPRSAARWLPKERWLADYCRSERAQGRKVLVYVRQTGTRDIQERVKAALEAAGLRVAVLSGNVSPRRREQWVEQRASRIDALITNPRLVETGLDLVQFATVVFYEIEYSLYTLWQACRRVWRLGQVKPVKVVYAVYAGAMESKALALMGRKMKAAQLLYGDEVGGAIVPEDGGDFLTELAREVLEGKALPDLRALFTDEGDVTAAATGSLTQVSPRLTLDDLIRVHGSRGNGGHRQRRQEVSEDQMALPGFG
jgi:SNF2 family DNA or RNA helicase